MLSGFSVKFTELCCMDGNRAILVPEELNNGKLKVLPTNVKVSEVFLKKKRQSFLCGNDLTALIFIVIGNC